MRQRILNNRAQPVELHLSGGVTVIAPFGEAEVDVDETGERHLEHMAAENRIAILPAAQEGGGASEAPPEGSSKKSLKKTRKR
jgi:hypothetical protein